MEAYTPKVSIKIWILWNSSILFKFFGKMGCVGFGDNFLGYLSFENTNVTFNFLCGGQE